VIYLLDTDTFIYMVRGLKILSPRNQTQKDRLAQARKIAERCRRRQHDGHEVGLSAITIAELEYGAHHSGDYAKEQIAVSKILSPFSTYDFDAAACAEQYGDVRHVLERAGVVIGAMDLLIAAHAKALGAILITNDLDHFSRITGLQCENWAR
jgi:tRNA(fMet)-specific endonuclease VapC